MQPVQMPRRTMDTSSPDCVRAGADRGWFRFLNGLNDPIHCPPIRFENYLMHIVFVPFQFILYEYYMIIASLCLKIQDFIVIMVKCILIVSKFHSIRKHGKANGKKEKICKRKQ